MSSDPASIYQQLGMGVSVGDAGIGGVHEATTVVDVGVSTSEGAQAVDGLLIAFS